MDLAVNLSNNGVLALCAVLTLAVVAFATINSWLKDRDERGERKAERAAVAHEGEQGEVQRIGRVVDHLTLTVIGRPFDPATGLPHIPGFIDKQVAHNVTVDDRFARIEEELTTTNGGGTLKGSLGSLKDQLGGLRSDFDSLRATLEAGHG